MHGLGNDFIVVDARGERAPLTDLDWPRRAPALCERRTGVGADGVLILSDHAGADCCMRIVNSDGSDGQMCGNGIRCVALLLTSGGPERELRIATAGPVVRAITTLRLVDGRFGARVDMGAPDLRRDAVPFVGDAPQMLDAPLPPALGEAIAHDWPEHPRTLTCVGMGNPHAVFFVEDADAVPVERIGPSIERHRMFPRGTNVQFAQVVSRHLVKVRTWERGAGATHACGTGACAVAAAGIMTGRLNDRVRIELPGGVLEVIWRDRKGAIMMTGPAQRVFDGVIDV